MLVDTQNLPTPKVEEWKYTNLPRAVPDGLTRETVEPIVIHKNRGEVSGQLEEILFTGKAGTLTEAALTITLEDNAEAWVIERHSGSGAYWKNIAVTIKLGANATLHHYRILEDNAEAVATIHTTIEQERDSVYNGFALQSSAKLQRNEIHSTLNGPNAEVNFDGLNLLRGAEHGDTTIVVEHQAPHCRSSQFYRSVLDDTARCVFQGKVHVHQIAQKTDGYQLSNALLLSDKAEMDTKPELEIYADDVKCSHGATTGQIEGEAIFYLRSRGLSEAQARLLLTQAFAQEVVDKIQHEDIRTEMEAKVEQWLQSVL